MIKTQLEDVSKIYSKYIYLFIITNNEQFSFIHEILVRTTLSLPVPGQLSRQFELLKFNKKTT